ncbi:single-stranded-DNA-specific exonuclease RecJ [Pedobacter frigiditerrae]|uniref:Single-stranded-DNA-specific exonuclease RecJ n=1 Tax=Pedobacter frigiditerrae TaxID=2530452 RepID=A0A4R0N6Z2_9SPHI|nr:single-stranded-DNA-specific exonuclease RecJ [Pedobacter frigiditerrae]TCC94452.1 single-stranded-DNA-specific exonuclease RecJ [Pedobacter frigiditerrae]
MEKRWALVEKGDDMKSEVLANELNIDKCLAQILVQRGITSFEEARYFFRPTLTQLHDPFLMKDMEKAIVRITSALQNQERIMVYGDYDVDGTTSVALTYSFFSQFTSEIAYYIPDRHKEGYGISTTGIDFAKANGFTLIIALDCGIRSVDKIAYANSLDVDFIICDHHLPGEELPNAIAVLDPKRKDCEYPFKELSGCGIGFKLAQAYCQANDLPEKMYKQYLDLCMVSIAADIVPIVDENRIMAHFGLIKLNENPCCGLKALMQISGKTETYSIMDVVFLLAPRINAAGRMGDAKDAVKVLLSDEVILADEQSLFINSQNTDRKSFDQNITLEALAIIEQSEVLINRKTTVVYQQDWNKGVIGIVASRLTEKYYRPTIVLTESNGNYTGSARSVAGYDLYEALLSCSDLLEQFGGHKYAAGLTIKPENLIPFSDKFESVVSSTITDDLLTPEIIVDCEIDLVQIDAKFYRILLQMAPFGPQNMAPVFITKGVTLVGQTQIVGTKHLKLSVKQQNSAIFETIGFNLGEFENLIKPNKSFSICYTIEENVWRDKKRLQLNIKGIKVD